jgi:hypothetical protein
LKNTTPGGCNTVYTVFEMSPNCINDATPMAQHRHSEPQSRGTISVKQDKRHFLICDLWSGHLIGQNHIDEKRKYFLFGHWGPLPFSYFFSLFSCLFQIFKSTDTDMKWLKVH